MSKLNETYIFKICIKIQFFLLYLLILKYRFLEFRLLLRRVTLTVQFVTINCLKLKIKTNSKFSVIFLFLIKKIKIIALTAQIFLQFT
jgi:hypothetical protein